MKFSPYQLLKKNSATKIKAKNLKEVNNLKDNEFIDYGLHYLFIQIHLKDQNNNARNSTTFSNYIRNLPIEDEEIMISLDITFLYTNISIADRSNKIKDASNDDQATRKNPLPQVS